MIMDYTVIEIINGHEIETIVKIEMPDVPWHNLPAPMPIIWDIPKEWGRL